MVVKSLLALCTQAIANNIDHFCHIPLPESLPHSCIEGIIDRAGTRFAKEDLIKDYEKTNPELVETKVFDKGWKRLYQKTFRGGTQFSAFLELCKEQMGDNFTWKAAYFKTERLREKMLRKSTRRIEKASIKRKREDKTKPKVKRLVLAASAGISKTAVKPGKGDKKSLVDLRRNINQFKKNQKVGFN